MSTTPRRVLGVKPTGISIARSNGVVNWSIQTKRDVVMHVYVDGAVFLKCICAQGARKSTRSRVDSWRFWPCGGTQRTDSPAGQVVVAGNERASNARPSGSMQPPVFRWIPSLTLYSDVAQCHKRDVCSSCNLVVRFHPDAAWRLQHQ